MLFLEVPCITLVMGEMFYGSVATMSKNSINVILTYFEEIAYICCKNIKQSTQHCQQQICIESKN
jgi:hypothetical protein